MRFGTLAAQGWKGGFADEGCNDVILYFYELGESDSFEAFASDVIPQLR